MEFTTLRTKTILTSLQIMFLFSSSVFSYWQAKKESECFISPEGGQHFWSLEEPLKIDFFIPPRWGRRNEHLNISINGKINYILTALPNTRNVGITRSINFPKEHIPKAGWMSIFLFYRYSSIQIEDNNENPFIIENERKNPSWFRFYEPSVTAKGMNALINCDSNLRTFLLEALPTADLNYIGKAVPVIFYKNVSQIWLFGNTTFKANLINERDIFYICAESEDPKANKLSLRSLYDTQCQLPLKKKAYFLRVSLSLVDQRMIEWDQDTAVGYIEIFTHSPANIYVQTYANFSGYLTESENPSYYPNQLNVPWLVSSSILILIMLLVGTVVIIWIKLRRKQTVMILTMNGIIHPLQPPPMPEQDEGSDNDTIVYEGYDEPTWWEDQYGTYVNSRVQ